MFARLFSLITLSVVSGFVIASTIVVSNRPLHSLATSVLEGVTTPILLLPNSQSLHFQNLKPSQALLARDADRVYWLGPLVEPELSTFQATHWVDVSLHPSVIWRPIRAWGDQNQSYTSTRDPQIWLDLENGKALVHAMAADAGTTFPDQASQINVNARNLIVRIEQLDRTLAKRFEDSARRGYAVSHDAYQYFEARYGLTSKAILSRDPHAGTSAFRVRLMADAIAKAEVSCLFSEPAISYRILKRLESEYAIPVIELDPLGFARAPGAELYLELIEAIGDGFLDCFQRGKP